MHAIVTLYYLKAFLEKICGNELKHFSNFNTQIIDTWEWFIKRNIKT